MPFATADKTIQSEERRRDLWRFYSKAPASQQERANRRFSALLAVEKLVSQGVLLMDARAQVAIKIKGSGLPGASVVSLGRWHRAVAGLERVDWLPALVPRYVGRTVTAHIPDEAWSMFVADHQLGGRSLRCYSQLEALASDKGWVLPSLRTFKRRLKVLNRPG